MCLLFSHYARCFLASRVSHWLSDDMCKSDALAPSVYITRSGRDLHRTLSWKFGDSLLLGSGTTASQSSFSDEGMIGHTDILSYDTPCFFSEETFSVRKPHDPSATGSLFVTVADSSTKEYHRMSTRVSRSISSSEILPYFGVDTHRYTLVLQFRYHYRMCRSSATQRCKSCVYTLHRSWYIVVCLGTLQKYCRCYRGPLKTPVLYLRNGAAYKHGTCLHCLGRGGGGGGGGGNHK